MLRECLEKISARSASFSVDLARIFGRNVEGVFGSVRGCALISTAATQCGTESTYVPFNSSESASRRDYLLSIAEETCLFKHGKLCLVENALSCNVVPEG